VYFRRSTGLHDARTGNAYQRWCRADTGDRPRQVHLGGGARRQGATPTSRCARTQNHALFIADLMRGTNANLPVPRHHRIRRIHMAVRLHQLYLDHWKFRPRSDDWYKSRGLLTPHMNRIRFGY
jgi:hypothetical protein